MGNVPHWRKHNCNSGVNIRAGLEENVILYNELYSYQLLISDVTINKMTIIIVGTRGACKAYVHGYFSNYVFGNVFAVKHNASALCINTL